MQKTVLQLLVLVITTIAIPAFGQMNNMKMTLLSLGSGSSRLSYERAVDEQHSAELTIGLIGAGFDILNHADPNGYLVKACYKWNLLHQPGSESPLAGLYVKPELIWVDFSYNCSETGYNTLLPVDCDPILEHHTHQLALLAECGYQFILKGFLLDAYCGLGPTLGTGNALNYYHGFITWPVDSHMAWTAGFRLGYTF